MLPFMRNSLNIQRKSISRFGGLNRTESRTTGEFSDCLNTSADKFPALCTRKKRSQPDDTGVNINGIGVRNGLFYTGTTDSQPLKTKMYCNGKSALVTNEDSGKSAGRRRRFAHQGDSLLIVPDNKIYNISDNSVYTVEYSKSINQSSAYALARSECHTNSLHEISDYVGEITSKGLVSSKFASSSYTSYMMTFDEIKEGDVVHLSMDVYPREYDEMGDNYHTYRKKMEDGIDLKVTAVKKTTYTTYQGKKTAITSVEFGENVLDMGGYPTVVVMSITLSRKMPPLEYVCSLNNRVWGVYDNTIRCSKLGDCSHWYDFSADAYGTLPSSCFSTEVDSSGEFTAVVPFGGSVVAFKENCLHKIYGSDPESYTLSTLQCKGVKSGCADTVAVLGGAVYYMGIDGVYAYRGNMPELVSKNADLSDCEAICAHTDGTNYYLAVKENDGTFIYTYYPTARVWHKESVSEGVEYMISEGEQLYLSFGSKIYRFNEKDSNEKFKWKFVVDFDEKIYNTRSYGRIFINYELAKDGEFVIKSVCNGHNGTVYISSENNHKENAFSVIPLPITGCKEFQLQFEGHGDFVLKNLTCEYITSPEETDNYI